MSASTLLFSLTFCPIYRDMEFSIFQRTFCFFVRYCQFSPLFVLVSLIRQDPLR